MPKKISDGSEHGAHILFDELIHCERRGSTFFVGARSNRYERGGAKTLDYTRALVAKLGQLLAEHDAEAGVISVPFSGISLSKEGEAIAFTLQSDEGAVASGRVTMGVGKKAQAFLNELFPPGNVLKFESKRA